MQQRDLVGGRRRDLDDDVGGERVRAAPATSVAPACSNCSSAIIAPRHRLRAARSPRVRLRSACRATSGTSATRLLARRRLLRDPDLHWRPEPIPLTRSRTPSRRAGRIRDRSAAPGARARAALRRSPRRGSGSFRPRSGRVRRARSATADRRAVSAPPRRCRRAGSTPAAISPCDRRTRSTGRSRSRPVVRGSRRRGSAPRRRNATARRRPRAAARLGPERLEHRAGVVDVAHAGRGREVEAAVRILLAREPRSIAGRRARSPPRAARAPRMRSDSSARRPSRRGATSRVSIATRSRPPKSVAVAPAAREREDRALERSRHPSLGAGRPQVCQQRRARRARGCRPGAIPAAASASAAQPREQRTGRPSPGRGPNPPSRFCGAQQIADGRSRVAARAAVAPPVPADRREGRLRRTPRSASTAESDDAPGAGQRTSIRARKRLHRAHQRRAEREREDEASDGVDEVEPSPLPT